MSPPPPDPERPRPAPVPPRLVGWWESQPVPRQLALALPGLSLLLALLNLGPFNQPLLRSIFYGVFEGGVLTALLLVATATEKGRRGR